jgi:hypothetical protein
VTALLVLKGTNGGKSFERQLWFSDTYVRTRAGWKYVFGQASTVVRQTPVVQGGTSGGSARTA